jgi:hypothetical protein
MFVPLEYLVLEAEELFLPGLLSKLENCEAGRLLPYYLLLSIWLWPKQNNLAPAMVIQNLSPLISYLHFTLFTRYSVRHKTLRFMH